MSPAGTLVPQTPNFDSLRFEIRKNRWIAKQSIQVESPENSVFWRVLGQSPNVPPNVIYWTENKEEERWLIRMRIPI